MTRRETGPSKSDLKDALLNVYEAAFSCSGSVADLRSLQDTCITEVESVIPDAEDEISGADSESDDEESN
jgi:hypothetical protein